MRNYDSFAKKLKEVVHHATKHIILSVQYHTAHNFGRSELNSFAACQALFYVDLLKLSTSYYQIQQYIKMW